MSGSFARERPWPRLQWRNVHVVSLTIAWQRYLSVTGDDVIAADPGSGQGAIYRHSANPWNLDRSVDASHRAIPPFERTEPQDLTQVIIC